MSQDLVSILTACYNATSFIHRLLDSVLNQSYSSIEMILIDDGSTDNLFNYLTSQSYFEKFESRGFKLFYYFQNNKGQASAIRNGLNKIKGEYLIWPDSDDFFNNDAIEKMIDVFNSNKSVAIVRCYSNHYDEKLKLQNSYQGMYNKKVGIDNIFLDCLYISNNMYFGAGNYIVNVNKLKSALKSYKIFEHKLTGQNWQLILPMVYNYKICTITLKLHNIVQFNKSHSRAKKNITKDIQTLLAHRNTLLHTLDNTKNLFFMERMRLKCTLRYIYLKRIVGIVLLFIKKSN